MQVAASYFCATQTPVRDTSFERHGWKTHNVTRYFVFSANRSLLHPDLATLILDHPLERCFRVLNFT